LGREVWGGRKGAEVTQTLYAHMNKKKKTIQDMKEEINKETLILRNNQVDLNGPIFPIKSSIENFADKLEHVKNRRSRREGKV
jgi:hypothetical protein